MIHDQDWLMREIEAFLNLVAREAFKKDKIEYRIVDEDNLTETDSLHKKLIALLEKGEICEAEDLLFDKIDVSNEAYIELALDFYQRVNGLSEKRLIESNFSRPEIVEGMAETLKKYGVDFVVPPED